MRNLVRFLSLVVAILASATPGAAAEQAWVEVRSPHFSVVTDGGEKRGREVALRFEQMRTIFGTLFTKVNVNIPVPLQIIAFRNQKELRANAPLFNGKPIELSGYYQMGEDRNFILLDLSSNNAYEAVFHEYAHLLLNGNFPRTPLWFDEGFAEYYSTIKILGKDVVIGDAAEGRMQYLYSNRINTLQLFSVVHESKEYNVSGGDRQNVYAHSWLMVHYLFDAKKLNEANAYFDLVRKNVPVDEAIKRAFGVEAKELDKTVDAFYRSGKLMKGTMKAPQGVSDVEFEAHPLSALDMRAMIADLHLHSPDYQEQAVTEFEAVLQEDGNNAAAHRGLGYAYLRKNQMDKAREHFSRAASLNSTDARVHYYSALLLNHQGFSDDRDEAMREMKSELEKAIALDPGFADSYSLLAFVQMATGDKDEAMQSLRKALQLNPRNENYQLNMARYLAADDKLDEAESLLKSLKGSDNPQTESMAESQLRWIAESRQRRIELQERIKRTEESSSAAFDVDETRETESGQSVAEVNVPLKPARFLKGRLTSVQCNEDGSAVLTIASGKSNWRMRTHNRTRLVLIGADTFSCDWRNKNVGVNYVPSAESQGSLISLELQ